MKIVAKFGGSSLANGKQIKKVADIIKNDNNIVAITVSAPGRRFDDDIKVTDLLIRLFREYTNKSSHYKETKKEILDRYKDIEIELGIRKDITNIFSGILDDILENIDDKFYLENALKSCGEDFNARIISEYLNSIGIKARYISPKDAGIIIDYILTEPSIEENTYENISKLKDINELIVVPGFYGYNSQGNILTFLRGGSDITGSILARGLQCDEYHNYTDMSYIYSAHPQIIDNPKAIKNITYTEMRELSYNGFEIFQEDAVEPLLDKNIRIIVKNTNHPEENGTVISNNRSDVDINPVIGISNVGGFTSFNITEYLMNRKIGYINKLLDIFEYQHIPVEHIPTGIDSLSVLIREENIESKSQLQSIKNAIDTDFDYDKFEVIEDLASIAIVGEGLTDDMTKALYLISKALNEVAIKVKFIIQGASNNSLFLFVNKKDEQLATKRLYSYFLEKYNDF